MDSGSIFNLWQLRYFYYSQDINPSTKVCKYCAALHSVVLYERKTWNVKIEDICGMKVLDYTYPWNINYVLGYGRVKNAKVFHRVLYKGGRSANEVAKLCRPRSWGHVIRTHDQCLHRKAMVADEKLGWKQVKNSQAEM